MSLTILMCGLNKKFWFQYWYKHWFSCLITKANIKMLLVNTKQASPDTKSALLTWGNKLFPWQVLSSDIKEKALGRNLDKWTNRKLCWSDSLASLLLDWLSSSGNTCVTGFTMCNKWIPGFNKHYGFFLLGRFWINIPWWFGQRGLYRKSKNRRRSSRDAPIVKLWADTNVGK